MQQFQSSWIFDQIVEQLIQIKKPDPETVFSDDFYSMFVFLLSKDSLFKKHEFYLFCQNLANKFLKIEDIEWGIIQYYVKNEALYTRFLQVFSVEAIRFSKKQKQILQKASEKVYKVEQFLNILTKIFQVQTNNHIIQKCYNLNKTYNKTSWSKISQNKDLEELDNYQDIIQISHQLYNSTIFKSIARQFSQKNQIDEVYQTIKQQIMPLIFYTAKQVSTGTGLDFSSKISNQSILNNQYISQKIIQEQPIVQNYLYILEKYIIEINQEEEQEMMHLNEILEFIFSDTKFNQYIDQSLVTQFMKNSRDIYRQVQITQQIMHISNSVQVDLPDQLVEVFKKLSKLQSDHENTYQNMMDFYNQNLTKFSYIYENVEDIQLRLIPVLKNYSNILNKWNDQILNDLKQSDEQDIAEQINWLIGIKKKLIDYRAYEYVQLLDKEKSLTNLLNQVSNIVKCIQQDQALTKQIEGVSISFQRIKDYLDEQQGGQSSISVMNKFLELGTIIITFQDIQGRMQEEIVFQIEEPLQEQQQPQQMQIANQQQGQNQNSSYQKKTIIKRFDMDEIYSIQSRLNLQVQNNQDDAKNLSIIERKQYFDILVKYSQHIAQTIIYLDEEGSLEEQIQQITVQIQNNLPQKIIQDLQEVINIYEGKIQQWHQTLLNMNSKYPVLQLIPQHLLRKFSYYIFKKYMEFVYQNESTEVNNRQPPLQIKESIRIQKIQFDLKNLMVESNCQNYLQMIFINPSTINYKAYENELTIFSDPNSEAQIRIELIAKILQDAFKNNNHIQLNKNNNEPLQICRKQVKDYQDCIKFLLRFPSISAYQVLICNSDTNFQDISCFFLRATKFQIIQKQQIHYEKYFLCNFDQLNYISQDQRDKQQLQSIVNYQIINDSWQDFLQINHDDDVYQDKVSVNKENIYIYTSKRAGEGKTYQIQQQILSKTNKNQYIRIPLHQFENLDQFISNIIKNSPNNELQKYYHLDVCYDETDEVSLLLYQILMLNCVSAQVQDQTIFENQIDEKTNFKDLQLKELQNLICKKYQKLNFKIDLDPQDNEIREKNKMKKYNNLDKDILALKVDDFIIVTQVQNQTTYQMQQIIQFLQQYIQIYNTFKQKQDQSKYELQIPDFSQNQQDSLAQIVVNIVCEQPGEFFNLVTKKNNENLQKILSNFVFSPDNAFKMVLIAFRIQARLPVIIMGETGIGKTQCIKILSELLKYEFRIIEIDSGLHVDKIVNAILMYQNDQQWDNQKVLIFLDEVNTTYCVNGIIKEIIIDRYINGVKIKDNIVFVAACNPYQYKKFKVEQDDLQANNLLLQQSQNKKSYELEYKVKPLRESFSYCIINFKSLEEEQELLYIENLIKMYQHKNEKCNISEKEVEQLKILLFQSQLFIRKESCERSVSLRDVNRFLILYFYFQQKYFRIKLDNENSNYDQNAVMSEVKQKSVILALYMVYYLRLQIQVKRELYLKFYEYLVNQNQWPNIKFKQTVDEELKWLTDQCGIQSQYIAKNNALQENIFCIIICLLNKIPLIITGEPGTSKTLSFSIALNCLKGNSQSKFFTSQPTIKEFYYQGNPQTTSKHIEDVFNQARKYQASMKSNFKVIPLVVIDEIGQGEANKNNPNKILHYQLENCDVAFLAISNVDLDVSNMNRCLHLYRQKFTEQDLKDFIVEIMKGFNNFPKEIEELILQIAQIYHKFQQGQKTQKHGTRDFYYTVKYTCHKLNILIESNTQITKQEAQKFIAKAFYKNFGGDISNQQIIMNLVKETYQLDNEILQISQADLIRESINSINNGDFYHSRFLMLVTKDPICCTNYVQSLFKQENKKSEVFMGSHFRDDHTVDLSKDISKLNSRIESGINVISVQQYYLYTIYYDFFTMNFIRMGENNTFRISYKQFSKRVQVKPEFIFVIIAHQDEYEHMDPALLNRFEKYIINLKDLLSEADRKLLVELKKEIRQLENIQSNMKLFTFSSESELYSLVIQQKHNEENYECLKQKCLNKLGDLTYRTYIFHNKNNENNVQYKDWLNRSYLDNLLSYLEYQKQQINQKQESFKSIIYTTSFMHDKYKQQIDLKGFNSKIISIKIYPTKDLFIQQLEEFYNKGDEDLLIIGVDQIYESYKNLCYLQYELQYYHSLYQQQNKKKLKNLILTIQLSSLNVNGLAFCENWNQVQIENLLPYVYTVPVNLSHKILEKANQKLNYRYLVNNNIITILTDKYDRDIFLYFISTPGFFTSLMTSIQINDSQNTNESNETKYTYLNSRINYFKKLISFYNGIQSEYQIQLLKLFYEQFDKKIRIDQNYDVHWSKNIQFPNVVYKKEGNNKKINKTQQIPIINFEKILINHLISYFVDQLSEIVVIMEKNNFIVEDLIIENEINVEQRKNQIEMIKQYFNFEYNQPVIKILQKIPEPFKLIQSRQMYNQLEENKFRMQYLELNNIKKDMAYLLLYIEDFSRIKRFLPDQIKEILIMLVKQNKLQSYQSIHQFCWDYEDILTEKAELFKCLKIDGFIQKLTQFIISNNINKQQLNTFYQDTSFQFVANQPLMKDVKKFTQQVNIFIKFFSYDNIDSQILIYLQKLREIIPIQFQHIYQEISGEILQYKSLGFIELQKNVQIEELSQIEQLKFSIKFNKIHLNANFINGEEKQIFIQNFLNQTFTYLQQVQQNSQNYAIDSQITSIIKQGVSIIVVQFIQENKDVLLIKLMQELQPNQQNASNISSILRQFFDQIKMPISSPLSIIFVETLYNELIALYKNPILQTLNFVSIYQAFKDSRKDHANLSQLIAISCLKILSSYLIDPIKQTMQNGTLEFQIQNKSFLDILTLMSDSFDAQDPQNNIFHNHIILQIIDSLPISIVEYSKKLDDNKQNQNQLGFIYKFISKYEDYYAKLQKLLRDKESYTTIFKINNNEYKPQEKPKLLNILNLNNNNLKRIQFIYPIISLIKIIYEKYAYEFNENDLKEIDLSYIFQNSLEINENQLLNSKIAIEKLLDQNDDDDDVNQLKLFELICPQKDQNKSRIFQEIKNLINIQNEAINQISSSQEKFIFDTTQSDFIEIKSDLFDKKHIYFFSDGEGKVNYEELQDYYQNEFLEFKPKILGLDKVDYKVKQQFYSLDLIYHNLQIPQKELTLDKIYNLENLNIDTESCIEIRNILIKLNQMLKVKGNKVGDSEVLITKLLQTNNIKEELDNKIIQLLDNFTCNYLCSLIQYFENKIMDYLISLLITRKYIGEQIQQESDLNKLIQLIQQNQIQINSFKNLIGRFIIRLNKNFRVGSLQNNLFQNIFDSKYQKEFFSSIESPLCSIKLQQEFKKFLFTNEDSYIIYQRLLILIELDKKQQQQELQNLKLEQNKNKNNQNAIKLLIDEKCQDMQQNIDQDVQDNSQYNEDQSFLDVV
ncbi:AAA domain, dynein subfamily protein (macronuclear) [Tetrahymena thermophila SB210]|uniref:AAA domain, dynein subfamily protein n=1 Tax=Tetrahymena thermophila (strain SB210) TaxID=312017 RepID=Q22MZ3_TETTS|nr:AAA domain, dynein subfamily protein [Tetrahymena thermophila SB210]EAR86253.2 AAA domain, dynein subfamily protein [Tetrahymena thermophila SB210]|eukprot:XP_976877.2 AAA domain, dynein subfamily protein [Tetrahymena thermophila SB210]